MSALSLGGVRRWSLGIFASAVVGVTLGVGLWACSSGQSAPQAANAPIGVEVSQTFGVTVENRAGQPLVDVDVAIMGGPIVFKTLVARVEDGEKRTLSLGDFRAQDGTTFSLRLARPKTVRVRAKDLLGKSYEVAVAW